MSRAHGCQYYHQPPRPNHWAQRHPRQRLSLGEVAGAVHLMSRQKQYHVKMFASRKCLQGPPNNTRWQGNGSLLVRWLERYTSTVPPASRMPLPMSMVYSELSSSSTNQGSRHAVSAPVCGSSIQGVGTLCHFTRNSSSAPHSDDILCDVVKHRFFLLFYLL